MREDLALPKRNHQHIENSVGGAYNDKIKEYKKIKQIINTGELMGLRW